MGLRALPSMARNCRSAVGSGWATPTGTRGRSGTSAMSFCISSDSAMTTGPGRPETATSTAWATISGMRLAWSIWVTHFAKGLNIRR